MLRGGKNMGPNIKAHAPAPCIEYSAFNLYQNMWPMFNIRGWGFQYLMGYMGT